MENCQQQHEVEYCDGITHDKPWMFHYNIVKQSPPDRFGCHSVVSIENNVGMNYKTDYIARCVATGNEQKPLFVIEEGGSFSFRCGGVRTQLYSKKRKAEAVIYMYLCDKFLPVPRKERNDYVEVLTKGNVTLHFNKESEQFEANYLGKAYTCRGCNTASLLNVLDMLRDL